MANSDGIITRKDMFSDDALSFGEDYAKNIEQAIVANNHLINSAKAFNTLAANFSKVAVNSEYLKLKKEESLESQKALNLIKEREAAELSAIKKQEAALLSYNKAKEASAKSDLARTKADEASRKAIEAKTRAQEKSKKLSLEERIQQQYANKLARQYTLEKLGLVSAYEKLNRQRTEAKNKLRDLLVQENASREAIKKAQKEFDVLDKKVRAADKAVGDFSKNVGNYPQITKLTSVLKGLVAAFGIQMGVQAFANGIKYAWSVIVEFDAAMTDLAAVLETDKKSLKDVKTEIIDVSRNSVNTAKDVAKLAVELAKLGASKEQIKEMVGVVDMFSVAMEASGEESAQFLLGIMNSFQASSSEAEHYGNVMANAANISALGFNELVNSMKYVAPVAKAANISLERITAMTGLLVDNNLEASQAGTALRAILLRIAKSGMTYEEAMNKISNSTDKLKTATKLFGTEASTAAIILASNTQKLSEYEAKLLDSEGALRKLNETKMDSLENQIKQVSSAWDGFILSIESGDGAISKFFITAAKGLTSFLNMLSQANKGQQDFINDAATGATKSTNEFIKSSLESDALTKKIIEQARKYGATASEIFNKTGNAYKKAEAEMTAYYSENRTELEKLVKAEQERFKQSSIYAAGTQKAKENLDKVTASIENQKKKIEELSETANNSSIRKLNKASFGIDIDSKELKEAREELQRLEIAQASYQATLQAYQGYGTETPVDAPTGTEDPTGSGDKELKRKLKAREDYLKRLQQLARDEYELQMWRLENERDLLKEIADDEEEHITTRIDSYYDMQAIELEIARYTAEHKLRELSRYDDAVRDLTDEQIAILTNGSDAEIEALNKNLGEKNKLTDAEILVLEKLQATRDAIAKRQEKNIQKIYDTEVKKAEKLIETLNREITIREDKELIEENNAFKALLDSNQATESEIEAHEKRVADIKKKYAKQALEQQLEAYKTLIDNSNLSADERAKAEAKYYAIKRQLSEADYQDGLADKLKQIELEKQFNEQMKDLAFQLHAALTDLVNVLFENKIAKYDEELAELEEYYSRQYEMAGDDQAQRQLLDEEAERKREAIEAKKRKEQVRQAIFNKAMRVMEIGSATALAIMQAYAQLGVFATPAAIMIGAVGAVQTAAVLAQKIPKYKKGRKGGPAELAITGDGFVNEVIEKKSGMAIMTPDKPTLTYLEKGDKVHSSVEDYLAAQRKNVLSDTHIQGQRLVEYHKHTDTAKSFDKDILEELKRNTDAINRNGKRQGGSTKIDIPHSIWKYRNLNWN